MPGTAMSTRGARRYRVAACPRATGPTSPLGAGHPVQAIDNKTIIFAVLCGSATPRRGPSSQQPGRC